MITSKHEFLERWNAGAFGNKLRTWNRLGPLIEDRYEGPVTIRSRLSSWRTQYYIPQANLIAVITKQMRLHNVQLTDLHFNESAPDERLILQGEYWNGFNRYLMYSQAQLAMKDALKHPLHIQGIKTDLLLREFMDDNSWDDFQLLRDNYPEHIIEFSIYDCKLGVLSNRNTIIWEVRYY